VVQLFIGVPRVIRRILKVDKGDVLEWHIEEDKVVVRKKA